VSIPRLRQADLSDGEWTRLRRRMQSPALWALQVLAGNVGLDAAVDACRLRDGGLPAEQREILSRGGFYPHHLPVYEAVVGMIFACRVIHRQTMMLKDGPAPLQAVAAELGVSLRACQAAIRAADALGVEGPVGT